MPRADSDDDNSYDSDLSGEESDVEDEEDDEEEEEEEEDDDDDEKLRAAEAKHKLVEADLTEIRKMMEEMDKIKMRLQFRLAREQSSTGQTGVSGPSRRRSSVDEIFVPPTVAAAVQTTWDMPRMYEVEKLISSSEGDPPKREAPPPIAPSVQLSMEDLARSYGVDDALFGARQPSSPVRRASRQPSAMEAFGSPQPTRQPSVKPTASLWDGLVVGGTAASDPRSDSLTSADKPPKLNRSQLIPESEGDERPASPVDSSIAMLEGSFGAPVSPTRSDAFAASHASESEERGKAKTMEQKEMEAMKNLLFF